MTARNDNSTVEPGHIFIYRIEGEICRLTTEISMGLIYYVGLVSKSTSSSGSDYIINHQIIT